MKTILINRHAKSDWADEGMADFDRHLNKRGERDAPEMAKRLLSRGLKIDYVVSSTANRAITTCKAFCDINGWDFGKVEKTSDIYENGSKAVKSIASKLDNKLHSVIFFGHNPDFSELITYFSGEQFGNLPTCGIVCIDFDTDNWEDVTEINGKIRFVDYPKNSD